MPPGSRGWRLNRTLDRPTAAESTSARRCPLTVIPGPSLTGRLLKNNCRGRVRYIGSEPTKLFQHIFRLEKPLEELPRQCGRITPS
jgi:hypothetical protein